MLHLTPQERFVVICLCLILFTGTLVNIGLHKNLRSFDWLHTAQKPTLIKSININKASVEDLLTIPGIGPKTAQFIVSYRQSKKTFNSLEPLREAKGMTPQRYERIIQFLTL